jgi:hypothetical protein
MRSAAFTSDTLCCIHTCFHPLLSSFTCTSLLTYLLLQLSLCPIVTLLQALGVLTRDGFLHLFATDSEDLASHSDLVSAVFSSPATNSRAAASAAAAAAGDAPAGESSALPPPALSPALISLAASLANNVSDMEAAAAAGTVQPVALARRSATLPGLTVQIGPSTALAFLPQVHPHAWEIGGERGSWFSGGRQTLRAGSVEEAAEWVVACTQMQDALAPVVAGGGPVASGSHPHPQHPPFAASLPQAVSAAAPTAPATVSAPSVPLTATPTVVSTLSNPSSVSADSGSDAASGTSENTDVVPTASESAESAAPDSAPAPVGPAAPEAAEASGEPRVSGSV